MSKCLVCGKENNMEHHKYCSRDCVHTGRRTRIKKICGACGGEFEVRAYRAKTARYCSEKCHPYRDHKIEKKCLMCGKEFKIKRYLHNRRSEGKFCSRECYHKSLLKQKIIICKKCGKEFKVRLSDTQEGYCSSKCGSAKEVEPKHYRYGKNWTTMKKKTLERDNHKCRVCGASKKVDVHHLIPREAFRTPEESNFLGNLYTACPNHHIKLERMGEQEIPLIYYGARGYKFL